MAYASLVVVTKAIDQILRGEQSYTFICSKDQMSSLREKVVRFQEFFEHISGKPRFSEVDELESRIRDVAYKIEDMVESILVWSFGQQDAPEVDLQLSSLPTALEFASCVEQVDLLLGEAMEMKKKVLDNNVKSGTSIYSHQIIATTSSPRGATDTKVGLDDPLTQILDRVTKGQPTREVIAITGMGGIGKTTLARAVFDYPGMRQHFDLVLWVTVSQDYDVQDILRQLSPENAGSDAIVSVHQRLTGRAYLIILDDVWAEKVWDGVRNAFPDDKKGSRIIVTTRLSNVATYVSSIGTHALQMRLLTEEQSWDLLQETVYGQGAGCPGELEDVGRTISRSCKGLPLALVVIGGLLKFNKAKDYWEEVAASTTADAAAKDESLLGVLTLSYTNLPPHLKACFLYLGSFPEDREIPTKQLVRLWSAEGFLKPKESKTVEEVAEECLEELVERNLVLVVKKRYDGKIETSSIHDVLRDLSLRQAEEEKFLYRRHGSMIDDVTFQGIIKDEQRRVSLSEFNLTCNVSSDYYMNNYEQSAIAHFKLLRVLGKVYMREYSSLGVLFRLTNLRYIHFEVYGDDVLVMPESISQLRNLETLMVSGDRYSNHRYQFVLPKQIWEMPHLRHLVSVVKVLLPPLPASDVNGSSIESSSLRTLRGVVNFDFTPSVIEKLQNLKRLKIYYSKDSNDAEKVYSLENLANLYHLEHLGIFCEAGGPRPTNIRYPEKLKELRLGRTELPWEHMALIGELTHLEVLKLKWFAFEGDIWEPIEGGFLQLKYLKMYNLELKEWRAESTHFPSLEKLVIDDCWYLEEVPSEIGEIDTLQKLIVRGSGVKKSLKESARRIQEEQQGVGNDYLHVYILSDDEEIPN